MVIEGSEIHSISDLYDQLNELFAGVDTWKIDDSLDALNDVLYTIAARDSATRIIWQDHLASAESLGFTATRSWLIAKLDAPQVFNRERINADIAALDTGTGQTYFQIVLEIFADHPTITLVLK